MYVYSAGDYYSALKQAKLLRKIQKDNPLITALNVKELFFIETVQPLTEAEINDLGQLLKAVPYQSESHYLQFYIVPRVSTISPWSSKATDILQHCGFNQISRIEHGAFFSLQGQMTNFVSLTRHCYDPLTQTMFLAINQVEQIFHHPKTASAAEIPLLTKGIKVLDEINEALGLALDSDEIHYLDHYYRQLKKNPTDVELMMFAQANSEHCRHKIFKAKWVIDGQTQENSLFDNIKLTYQPSALHILSAYKDNAAVMKGHHIKRFYAKHNRFQFSAEDTELLIKVETHNHPTAISPYPGAATGSGGEIRDEGATGRGSKPKAGIVGYSVSNLHIPSLKQPWENNFSTPTHIASAFTIMQEAPIGAAGYNNEFGRPAICGYMRSFEYAMDANWHSGYHKPIMIAGGLGHIKSTHIKKISAKAGDLLIVLGGPAMTIGLGGGAASSMTSGESDAKLDFASVQRDNPEMQRRCQEVIDACVALGDENPIISIHDVGAGGLSNALPELIHDSEKGGEIFLAKIPCIEEGMTPLAIWCNESQERYVLTMHPAHLLQFEDMCLRERCPYAVVGKIIDEEQLQLIDEDGIKVIDVPMDLIFGYESTQIKNLTRKRKEARESFSSQLTLTDGLEQILQHPTVASKKYLITIGDRTVGGLTYQDQLVGPWQVPVADAGVIAASFTEYAGEAIAMGERAPIALINAPASGRMAIAEAITNIAGTDIGALSKIVLSANWMADSASQEELINLYDTVKAVSDLCLALNITIPVGKDSLSMRTVWKERGQSYKVSSPLSLIVSAFAPVKDIRKTVTPMLKLLREETLLLLIDLSDGKNRLGGSILAQIQHQLGEHSPDLDDPLLLVNFFNFIQALIAENLLLAYHDKSDGGLWATLCEMAFAGKTGLSIQVEELGRQDPLTLLANEELGGVIQVKASDLSRIQEIARQFNLPLTQVAKPQKNDLIQVYLDQHCLYQAERKAVEKLWSRVSFHMQFARDNPLMAEEEWQTLDNVQDPGLFSNVPEFTPTMYLNGETKPRMAILREQGVNGQLEMAAAFTLAGFDCVDVHMSDLLENRQDINDYHGLVACGGFSYGDVLGAGTGWANVILYHEVLKEMFAEYFSNKNKFALGICNGCQMMSQLNTLIPGAERWPKFVRNKSEQFEARLSMVEIGHSSSLFFQNMQKWQLPIVVSHGEGQVQFSSLNDLAYLQQHQQIALQYIDNGGYVTEDYPMNPNGSLQGITGICNEDGRVTLLMPHPERIFRSAQASWHPTTWEEYTPWFQMFINARQWVG